MQIKRAMFIAGFILTSITFAQQHLPFQEKFLNEFNPEIIKEGKFQYNVKYSAGNQRSAFVFIREIKASEYKKRNIYRIIDRTINPNNESVDTVFYDAITLQPLRQHARLSQTNLNFDFSNSGMKGEMQVDTNIYSVDLPFQNFTLPASSTSEFIISTLPLQEEYTSSIVMFDLFTMSVKSFTISVLAKEKLMINSKSYVTYKVEIKSSQEAGVVTRLWVGIKDKVIYRMDTMISMFLGGGVTSAELQ